MKTTEGVCVINIDTEVIEDKLKNNLSNCRKFFDDLSKDYGGVPSSSQALWTFLSVSEANKKKPPLSSSSFRLIYNTFVKQKVASA